MPRKHLERRRRAARPHRDALALLQSEHDLIIGLFGRFATAADGPQGSRLLGEACHALEVHTQIEEELFYPAVRGEIARRDWLEEGEVEHRTLDALIEELRALPASQPRARATATVLTQFLRQHLQNEERRLFPHVRRGGVDLVGLGELLRSRREDILAQRPLNGSRRNGVSRGDYSGFAPF